jgi:AAA domain
MQCTSVYAQRISLNAVTLTSLIARAVATLLQPLDDYYAITADQEQTLKHARVTGVTCAGSVSSVQLQQGGPYDIIILDECSQQIEPLSLLPLAASQALRTVLVRMFLAALRLHC